MSLRPLSERAPDASRHAQDEDQYGITVHKVNFNSAIGVTYRFSGRSPSLPHICLHCGIPRFQVPRPYRRPTSHYTVQARARGVGEEMVLLRVLLMEGLYVRGYS
jgi:hypothetical protein